MEDGVCDLFFQRIGEQSAVMGALRLPDGLKLVEIHVARGTALPYAPFIDGIHAGEEFAEGPHAPGGHAFAQLVDGGLHGSFVLVLLARLAVAEVSPALREVVEGAPELVRVQGMVEGAAAEEIGELVEHGNGGFARLPRLAVFGVDVSVEGLEKPVALLRLAHGAFGEEPVTAQEAGEVFDAAAAAFALAAALTGFAPLDAARGIFSGLDVALGPGIEHAHAAVGQAGGLAVGVFEQRPSDRIGAQIQAKHGILVDGVHSLPPNMLFCC